MHFEIRSAIKPGTQLTPAQRSSSFFSEVPVIAGKQIRRGAVLKFSAEQMDANRLQITRLLKGEAIIVTVVDDEPVAEAPSTPVVEIPKDETPVVEKTPDAPKSSKKAAKAAAKDE